MIDVGAFLMDIWFAKHRNDPSSKLRAVFSKLKWAGERLKGSQIVLVTLNLREVGRNVCFQSNEGWFDLLTRLGADTVHMFRKEDCFLFLDLLCSTVEQAALWCVNHLIDCQPCCIRVLLDDLLAQGGTINGFVQILQFLERSIEILKAGLIRKNKKTYNIYIYYICI